MQTTQAETNGDLMAIWRATGGAVDMTSGRSDPAGDDGLQAGLPTMLYGLCIGDDGLQAGAVTMFGCPPHFP